MHAFDCAAQISFRTQIRAAREHMSYIFLFGFTFNVRKTFSFMLISGLCEGYIMRGSPFCLFYCFIVKGDLCT